jgi:hypothetical protein
MNKGIKLSSLKNGDKVVICYCDTSATVVHSEHGIVKDRVIYGKYNTVPFSEIDGCYVFLMKPIEK